MSAMLYPCVIFVALLMELFGCGCYFVVECYGSVYAVCVKVLCWTDLVCSSRECACDPSVHLSVSSIGFVYV